jgi:hypothetical protein
MGAWISAVVLPFASLQPHQRMGRAAMEQRDVLYAAAVGSADPPWA